MRLGHRQLGRRTILAIPLWFVLAVVPITTMAHDGVSRIVVEPPIAHPGDDLVVHGQFLWTDQPVTVAIVSSAGISRQIGSSMTLGDGSLEARVRVPVDLATGVTEIVVTNSVGETAAVELVVTPVGLSMPVGVAVAAVIALALLAALGAGRLAGRRRVTPIGTTSGDQPEATSGPS